MWCLAFLLGPGRHRKDEREQQGNESDKIALGIMANDASGAMRWTLRAHECIKAAKRIELQASATLRPLGNKQGEYVSIDWERTGEMNVTIDPGRRRRRGEPSKPALSSGEPIWLSVRTAADDFASGAVSEQIEMKCGEKALLFADKEEFAKLLRQAAQLGSQAYLFWHPLSHLSQNSPASASSISEGTILSTKPVILTFDNVLTFEECDALTEYASKCHSFDRSRVVGGKVSTGRTSRSAFMNTAPEATQVTNVRSKAKHLIESEKVRKYRSKPLEMCEPLQVAHYGEGDYFVRHFDNPSGSLQRCCTVIFYLNDPIRGGCTSFPRAHSLTFGCSSSGIKVYPKKGRALVFFSVRNGAEDRNSLHEGNAVEQGEKWIATQWFTESNCF